MSSILLENQSLPLPTLVTALLSALLRWTIAPTYGNWTLEATRMDVCQLTGFINSRIVPPSH